jgi:DNA-binding MarR family transcriptional regulator
MAEAMLLDLIYRAHRLLGELESTPRDYGTGDLLYSTDLHTIVAVSRSPGCNLTELAIALDVSKPAASKFIKKLLGLGYLVKERARDSEKEVSFYLSEAGERAAHAHEKFEKRTFGPLRAIEAALQDADKKTIRAFLESLQEALERK